MLGSAAKDGSRYRVIRVLGVGGMGVVELVHDAVRDENVARKRVLEASPEALLRFKREFRAIEALRHPNLVRLYELGEDEGGAYFTMEYVEGASLLAYCAPQSGVREAAGEAESEAVIGATEPVAEVDRAAATRTAQPPASPRGPVSKPAASGRVRCDWGRLEEVVPQIADGLACLHAHGIVHCDLKPSNVLVRADGVVKVLDFGVIAELRAPRARGEVAAGTLEYMAPERLRGEPATAAVDAYALGVILFEMVSGRRPFAGTSVQIANAHLNVAAPRLDEVATGVPARWTALCASLLRKAPGERASIEELCSPGRSGKPSVVPQRAQGDLVGREDLLRVLGARGERAGAGPFEMIVLAGASGVGKTALAEWIANFTRGRGGVTLRGRGSPSERVAFNGIDGVVDDLARSIARGDAAMQEATAVARAAAATTFPVMGGASGLARAEVDRLAAFEGITSLLACVASVTPVTLLVDDAQWADADALALLESIVAGAPARVLIVATMRDDVEETPAMAWLRRRAGDQTLHVGALASEAIAELVAREAARLGAKPDASAIRRYAEASAGRPFLAELAARSLVESRDVGEPIESSIGRTVRECTPRARDALALLLALGAWTPVTSLAPLLGWRAGEVAATLDELVAAGLARRDAGAELGAADVYHDMVRAHAAEALGAAALAAAHRKIVVDLRRRADVAPYRLVHHLLGAGANDEAAALAREAARGAEEQRVYSVAAAMYAVALAADPSDAGTLMARRARALERTGSYRRAAECWGEVVLRASTPDAAHDAAVREAQAWLGGYELDRGLTKLNEILAARGEARIVPGKVSSPWAGVRFVIGPIWRERLPKREVTPAQKEQLERDLQLAQFVFYFDPLGGIRLLQRARRDAIRSGAYAEASYCDSVFVLAAEMGHWRAGPSGLAARYRTRAARALAAATSPYLEAEPAALLARGWGAMRQCRWNEAEQALDAAIERIERAGLMGTLGHLFVLYARYELEGTRQNVLAAERHFRRLVHVAREAGAGTMRFQLELAEAQFAIIRGDFAAVRRIIDAIDSWLPAHGHAQRAFLDLAGLGLALAERNSDAWARAQAVLTSPLRPLKVAYAAMIASFCALACIEAIRRGDPTARDRDVHRLAKIARQGFPVGRAGAQRALAYLAEIRGDPARAIALLKEAEDFAGSLGLGLDMAYARYRRGQRIGGEEGRALVDDASRVLSALGVNADIVARSAL